MSSLPDFTDSIQATVKKLDYKWFEQKTQAFEKDKKRFGERGGSIQIKILLSPSHAIINEETGEIEEYTEEETDEIIISLEQYCACYLPISDSTDWGDHSENSYPEEASPSNNIYEFASEVVQSAFVFVYDDNDPIKINRFIGNVLTTVNEQLEVNVQGHEKSSVYVKVLDNFLKEVNRRLNKKFEKVLSWNVLSESEDYTIKIDLNLGRWVALLYILDKAKIINNSTVNKVNFLNFINQHFRYLKNKKDGVYIKSTTDKSFRNAFEKIDRGEEGDTLDELKKLLRDTMNNYPE